MRGRRWCSLRVGSMISIVVAVAVLCLLSASVDHVWVTDRVCASAATELIPPGVLAPTVSFTGDRSSDPFTSTIPATEEAHLDRVADRLRNGDYAGALEQLDSVGAVSDSDRASYYRVLSLCGLGRAGEAEALAAARPSQGVYRGLVEYALGLTYLNWAGVFDTADVSKAMSHLELAAQLLPVGTGAVYFLGVSELDQTLFDRAAQSFRRCIEDEPDFGDAHANLGFALLKLGDAVGAIGELELAQSLGVTDIRINVSLGDAYMSLSEYAEAAVQFGQVVAQSPGYHSARYKRAWCLLQAGDVEDAEIEAKALIRMSPKYFGAHMIVGEAALARQDLAAAVSAYGSALDLSPGHFAARIGMAEAYLGLGDPTSALRLIDEAIAIYNGDAQTYYLRAQALLSLGRRSEAIESAHKAVLIDPSNETYLDQYESMKLGV